VSRSDDLGPARSRPRRRRSSRPRAVPPSWWPRMSPWHPS